MFLLLYRLWSHCSRKRKIQLWLVLILMIVSSLAESVSLAAVIPFLSVISSSDHISSSFYTSFLASYFTISTPNAYFLLITCLFVALVFLSSIIRLLNLRLFALLAASIGSDISCLAFSKTLHRPYGIHLSSNSSGLINSIVNDVNIIVYSFINPVLILISSALILFAIICTLLIIEPLLTILSATIISALYLLSVLSTKATLLASSNRQLFLSRQLVLSLQESLGSIRDIILSSSFSLFEDRYKCADYPLRRLQAESRFLSSVPRLILEPAGIIFIACTGYFLLISGKSDQALLVLGPLALGAQRLLPMVQKIFEGWAQSRSATASLISFIDLLDQPTVAESSLLSVISPLELNREIQLKDVCFTHYKSDVPVLSGFNLTISKGERIGIMGQSGCGKSTLIDVMMGLFTPSTGQLLVDGIDLYEPSSPTRIISWRKSISQVPQTVYLSDGTFAQNIAYAVPPDMIDMQAVSRAAKLAQISDYIESTPQSYLTSVGERGSRLSGGQRQRIGIARALYTNPTILFLDEATSALDHITEEFIIDSLSLLPSSLTIIIVAHRLSTLRHCDRVIRLDNGVVVSDTPVTSGSTPGGIESPTEPPMPGLQA